MVYPESVGADNLYFDTTIRLQTFDEFFGFLDARAAFVTSYGLLLPFAFCINTVWFNTFTDQICLDCFGTLLRQFLVVFIRTDAIGMAHGNNDLKFQTLQLVGYVIQFSLAFWAKNGFVKIEKRISGQRDFLGGRLGCCGLPLL